ncbi:hypothetical protein X975_11762, partial [Stegodyphus mimosarum]
MTYAPPIRPTRGPLVPMRPTPPRDPYWYHTATEQPTTKPWKPITGRPRPDLGSGSNKSLHNHLLSVLTIAMTLLFYLRHR